MEYRSDVYAEELCPVCGDKVSGYHYGVLTCESCKGFFKRTVQNNKTYNCAETQQCRIDQTLRKRCPFCRFQRCLHAGMRLEAVRADRMRGGRNKFGPMYRRERALKQHRKALIQVSRLDGCPTVAPTDHHKGVPPAVRSHPASVVLPWSSPGGAQFQYHHPWAGMAQHSHSYADSAGVAAGVFISPCDSRLGPTQHTTTPNLVLEFLRCDPDELQLQNKIKSCLQQEQASPFHPVYAVADQLLCSIVEWARKSPFFKQLKVSDQMKMLHFCWSELLVLDIISRQVLYGKEGSLLLVTGQQVDLSKLMSHLGPALANLAQRGNELLEKLQILKVDHHELTCIKFLILFNPDIKELEEHRFVESVQEQVEGALLEHTLNSSGQPCRFPRLLLCLAELRSVAALLEDYLYCRHLSGEVPCNNLLHEMLHAKHSWI